MASSRFPGKPLKPILGMPMLGHCYFRAKNLKSLHEVYVATCDIEIADYVKKIGGKYIMTSRFHTRAVDRTAEALKILQKKFSNSIKIVLMIQADEPLIPTYSLKRIILKLKKNKCNIVNLMSEIESLREFRSKNNVKVVINKNYEALYFSREPIPSVWKGNRKKLGFMQTGIIGFKSSALQEFTKQKETFLEKTESIDLNRCLTNGKKIQMICLKEKTIGVDTPSELKMAERLLQKSRSLYLKNKKIFETKPKK